MSELQSLERSCGDHRIVYECLMGYDYQIRTPDGGYGDTVFSHNERRQRTWHVIATTQALAEAAWQKQFGFAHLHNELVSCTAICVIDKELVIR